MDAWMCAVSVFLDRHCRVHGVMSWRHRYVPAQGGHDLHALLLVLGHKNSTCKVHYLHRLSPCGVLDSDYKFPPTSSHVIENKHRAYYLIVISLRPNEGCDCQAELYSSGVTRLSLGSRFLSFFVSVCLAANCSLFPLFSLLSLLSHSHIVLHPLNSFSSSPSICLFADG